MNILGIGSHNHDASAALVMDGQIVFSAAEERFDRVKHSARFPFNAVRAALKRAGIGIEQVDAIAFYMDYRKYFQWLMYDMGRADTTTAFVAYAEDPAQLKKDLTYRYNLADLRLRQIRENLGFAGPVVAVGHHLAHAASAFFNSGFDQAAILTMDAIGEWDTTSFGVGQGSDVRCFRTIRYPHSLGTVYKAMSVFLGFGENDSGKTMGLAAYGDPAPYRETFRDWVKLTEDGGFAITDGYLCHRYVARYWSRSLADFGPAFLSAFGKPRQGGDALSCDHENIAAALQERLEQAGVHLARHLKAVTSEDKLCIAGGVGLNGVMNYRILREAGFDSVFVPPPAGDDGASLGAAQYLSHVVHGEPRRHQIFSPYLGSCWNEGEMSDAAARADAIMQRVDDPAEAAARRIADGKIIGWFQGRSEVGPRALGNRSILADARHPEMKDTINDRVKFREPFRPFAPACLAEHAAEYFMIEQPSPYMLMVAPVKPEKRDAIPAVMHVDGTARIQTVTRSDNPIFYDLILRFHELTGMPLILNTSFNVRGEPIVNSPFDAVRCFESTALDALVMGPFVLDKATRD